MSEPVATTTRIVVPGWYWQSMAAQGIPIPDASPFLIAGTCWWGGCSLAGGFVWLEHSPFVMPRLNAPAAVITAPFATCGGCELFVSLDEWRALADVVLPADLDLPRRAVFLAGITAMGAFLTGGSTAGTVINEEASR